MIDTQNQGVSTPPNGGQVDDTGISVPDSNDATVAQTSAPNTPPSQAPTPNNAAPQQQPQAPGQPQTQGSQPMKKLPLGGENQPGVSTPVPQSNPAVQKAGIFHDIAETLGGGPRYNYTVDNQGNLKQTKVPVSNAHLALAIAMEALSGAATGFANGQGPAGAAKATGASFAQGQQQVQQQDQQQRQQATADFARKAQVTETNMRLYANARAVGRQDEEATDKYIAQYAPIAAKLQDQLQGYVHEAVGYAGLKKYNATEQTAIPYKRVPRLDDNGKQSNDKFGNPQWDIDYLVVDPKFKTSGLITPEMRANLKEMGYNWADNDMVDSAPINGTLALGMMSKAATWGVAKQTFSNFFNVLDTERQKTGKATTNADITQEGALKVPPIKNANIASLVDSAAGQYYRAVKGLSDIISPTNFKALLHGMVHQESNENTNALSSKGAAGVMQLMPATATSLGVTDPNDMGQNIRAGVNYFAQMLAKFRDPKLALAAYNAGPTKVSNSNGQVPNIPETQDYVKRITGAVGLQGTQPVQDEQLQHPDLAEYTKEHPTTPGDVEKFIGALNGTDGNYGQALNHLRTTGQGDAANNMAAYLGGPDNIKEHDDIVTAQAEARKAEVQTEAQEARLANKQAATAATDKAAQDAKQEMLGSLENAKMPDNVLQQNPHDVINNLTNQGVSLPGEAIRDAMAIARYEAPINVTSNKLWYKDRSLTQQDMLDVVRQFNPSYNVDNYKDLHTFTTANSKASQTFQAAAAVSNHLNMLVDLAHAVKSGAGQYPLINKLENELNYHTGGTDYSRLQALTGAVNDEMGKVLSGGFAPQKGQVDQIMKNMTAENSEQQIDQLAELYTGVMHGKIAPYDEQYNQLSGAADKHVANIPASFTRLAQRYRYETPWAKQGNQQTAQPQTVPGQREGEIPQYVGGQLVGFTKPGAKGMRPITPQQ